MKNSVFSIQGHRGCRGLLPENSIPAFKHAIDLGVNAIEMDVVITGDSQVLVSHDPFMNSDFCLDRYGNRISKGEEHNFNIYRMNIEDIALFDCGSLQHPAFPEQKTTKCHKPLLERVFQEVEDHLREHDTAPIIYNIEIKSKPKWYNVFQPPPEDFAKLIVTTVSKSGIESRIMLQSFDVSVMNYLAKYLSTITKAILIEENENAKSKIESLNFKPDICGPHHKLVDERLVDYCHDNDIQIIPWTVNDVHSMKTLIDMQVDGIITDYPDRLLSIM